MEQRKKVTNTHTLTRFDEKKLILKLKPRASCNFDEKNQCYNLTLDTILKEKNSPILCL